MKIIKSLPIKSGPLDSWSAFLLMECIDILIIPITRIVNLSLMEGLFLQEFKQAIIIPLLKKPTLCKEKLPNYSPVSNLLYISKVLERVVASQLSLYLSTCLPTTSKINGSQLKKQHTPPSLLFGRSITTFIAI